MRAEATPPSTRTCREEPVAADRLPVTTGEDDPEHGAAEWFVLLREEPDNPQLREQFEQWLSASPSHAMAWEEIGETARIMASLPLGRSNRDLPPEHSRRRALPWSVVRHRPARAAAAAAMAACLLALLVPSFLPRLQADYMTGMAQIRSVRLPDGSMVQLAPDSAISVDYTAAARSIHLLSGQAMFEVQPDRQRPFHVLSPHLRVTVLGTGFNISDHGDLSGVAVRHGRVRVESSAASFASRNLKSGDWVRAAPGRPLESGTDLPELVGAWRNGRVAFRNRPIAEAIEQLRPWYSGKIIVANRNIGKRRITGVYDFRDPMRSLELAVTPYGGHVTRITPWLTIVTAD